MTKDIFINDLRRALAMGLSSTEIEIHVKYYNEYIATEMSKGKNEAQILDELGDPRLISKSILEAKGDGEKQFKEEKKAEIRDEKLKKIPNIFLVAITILSLIIIIAFIFRLFIQLIPILIIVGIVLMFVAFIKKL